MVQLRKATHFIWRLFATTFFLGEQEGDRRAVDTGSYQAFNFRTMMRNLHTCFLQCPGAMPFYVVSATSTNAINLRNALVIAVGQKMPNGPAVRRVRCAREFPITDGHLETMTDDATNTHIL